MSNQSDPHDAAHDVCQVWYTYWNHVIATNLWRCIPATLFRGYSYRKRVRYAAFQRGSRHIYVPVSDIHTLSRAFLDSLPEHPTYDIIAAAIPTWKQNHE